MNNFIKEILIFSLLLISSASYSQIIGKWKVIKYKPEIELDKKERIEMQNRVMGKIVYIDSIFIKYPGNKLIGVLNKRNQKINIIDRSEIPDSLQSLVRYFCQEVYNLGVVTKQTILFLDPTYKSRSLQTYFFRCKEDKAINCAEIYLLTKRKCGLAIPGDGLFVVERLNDF